MNLLEVKASDVSELGCHFTACGCQVCTCSGDVFIAAFEGSYGLGSAGNGDARYMTAMVKVAVTLWTPSCLVLDLREVVYSWGDAIIAALQAVVHEDPETRTVIVVSDKSKAGICSLFSAMGGKIEDVLFDNLDAALSRAHVLAEEYLA